jgi:hypothetical protein
MAPCRATYQKTRDVILQLESQKLMSLTHPTSSNEYYEGLLNPNATDYVNKNILQMTRIFAGDECFVECIFFCL